MTFDWQSVVVTVIAFAAAVVIVRRFVPAKRRPGRPGAGAASPSCDHCAAGAKAMAAAASTPAPSAPSRTQTTPVVSVGDLRKSARRH